MPRFAICDDVTGAILSIGSCHERDILLQAGAGGFMVRLADDAAMDDTTHYWRDGEGWTAYPPQPSPHHIYDHAAQAWVDPRTAADIDAAARASAQAAARAYLAETDWMVVRAAETGKPVPEDVQERRAAARGVANA